MFQGRIEFEQRVFTDSRAGFVWLFAGRGVGLLEMLIQNTPVYGEIWSTFCLFWFKNEMKILLNWKPVISVLSGIAWAGINKDDTVSHTHSKCRISSTEGVLITSRTFRGPKI